MKIKISTVLISSVVVTSGAFAQGANVSSETTDAFLAQFAERNEATQKEWRGYVWMRTHTGEKIEGWSTRWVQPLNKKAPCKIYQSTWVKKGDTPSWDDDRVYWDGDCRNGYAHGIGREFLVANGELSSWLADYNGDQKEPTYHLTVYYDRQIIQFSAKSHPYNSNLTYSVQQSPTGKRTMWVDQELIDLSEDRMYKKFVEIGADTFKKAMALPNGNKYVGDYNVNPAAKYALFSLVTGKGERTGYAISFNDNGITKSLRQLNFVISKNPVDVILPESYRSHLNEVDGKIDSNLSIGDKLLQESYVAVNKYKRRICKGDVRVDFVDNEIYGRICLEGGELSPYAALFADSEAEREKRHVKAREDITRQKAEQQGRSEEAARRQAAQEQQNRNNEIARREASRTESAAAAQGVNNFAKDMADLNRNAAQFTNSFMNSFPSPSVSFGQTEVRTNCVRVANVVNCNSR